MSSTQDDILSAVQAWADAFNQGDAGRVTSLYDEGATLWGTYGVSLVHGSVGLHAYFDAAFAQRPRLTVALGEWTVSPLGQAAAIAAGAYTFLQGGVELPARFSMAFVREPLGWRVVHHHSSLVPVAG